MMPSKGNQALTRKMKSILVLSANQPKKAEPIPPNPNIKPKKMPEIIVEDGASIRAVKRVYGEASGDVNHTFEPKDICEIAAGKRPGDVEAAKKAFAEMGEIAGDAMATAVTLVDGLIVIGGGITAARKWIMPSLLNELRSKMHQLNGNELNRVQMKVYDLDDETEFREFA